MAEIDELMLAQLGLAHGQQALDAGMSLRTIARRHEQGLWDHPQPNVHRSLMFPQTREQRLLAATLSAGLYAAISHRAATAKWGVEGFDCDLVELCHPFHHSLRLKHAIVHRSSDLVPNDITTVDGIPITTRARTLIDLGAVARPSLVKRALEQWLTEGHVTVAQVRDALDEVARRGRQGAGVLREILDGRALRDAASDSLPELVLAETIRSSGFPSPVFHHLIRVDHEVFEVDFAFPELMLVVEVDGYGPHTKPEQFEEDRRRQNLLVGAGHVVLRYTAKRVLRRPTAIAVDIERARAQREHALRFRGAAHATDGTPRAPESQAS